MSNALDYLKGCIANSDYTYSGEVTTHCKVLFNNGISANGIYVCDASGFVKQEADKAAHDDAIKTLIPGVEFVLNKK